MGLTKVDYVQGTVYPHIILSSNLYPCGSNTCVFIIGVQGIPKSIKLIPYDWLSLRH